MPNEEYTGRRLRNMGNRIMGAARAALFGTITYITLKNAGVTYQSLPLVIPAGILTLDGLADIVLGDLHSIPTRILRRSESKKNAS